MPKINLLLRTIAGVFAIASLAFIAPAHAKPTRQHARPTGLPGQPCAIPVLPQWTPQERWVWRTVCQGDEADLAARFIGYTAISEAKRWPSARILSARFLQTILLHEPFRSALGPKGVRIHGAVFKETIDLEGADIKHELSITSSVLERGIDLTSAHAAQRLTFDGTLSQGPMTFRDLRMDQSLFMSSGGSFMDVDLMRAKIDGSIFMEGSSFSGRLDMDAAGLGGDIFLRGNSSFASVNLRGARIARQLGVEATFSGEFVLNSLDIGGNFLVQNSNLKNIEMRGAKVAHQISIETSTTGEIDMDSLDAGENLLMYRGNFQKIILREATVRRDINLNGSTFNALVDLDSVDITGNLALSGDDFQDVNLHGAKIGGELAMSGSRVAGPLAADALTVGTRVLMNAGATFRDIKMNVVKIGSMLDMTEATFLGNIHIENLQIGGYALLRTSTFASRIEIILSKIDGSVTLAQSTLNWLDLSGTSINGELNLAGINWQRSSRLLLRNTTVGVVADGFESWPGDLAVSVGGFTYQRWGGLDRSPPIAGRTRSHPALGFSYALAGNDVFSPQPYEQLASTLRTMGYPATADDTLFEEKKLALFQEPGPAPQKIFQALLMIFIGFGYRIYYALLWSLLFIIIGAVVITHTKEGQERHFRFGIAYSLDNLIPLIKLREAHYQIDFPGGWRPARYYFYFHKLMGWVLGTFLVAGLGGLTK